MATFLDLPEEIRPLVAKLLGPKTIFSCIRVCRSFYSSFIPFLWADLVVKPKRCHAIAADHLRANAHWIESLAYTSTLTKEEYYTIAFPRLRTMTLSGYFLSFDSKMPPELPVQKVQFARLNPTIRKLTDFSRGSLPLPREFWEIVRTEWKNFESLEFSGTIEADVVDIFWRVCDRVQDLYLGMMDIQGESHSSLQDLSFRQLRSLRIGRNYCIDEMPERMWPLQLITQVKGSAGLRRLTVEVTAFPIELIVEALEEGCWPELCEYSTCDPRYQDQDLAQMFKALTSGRLLYFELVDSRLGPLTFSCLRELYFSHLRELDFGRSNGVPTEMVQEILTECIHLVTLDVPHIFVRDIATASKPWGCLGIQKLVVFIAKQPEDEDGWDSRVFEQISKLRRLETLDLRRDPYLSFFDDEPRPDQILDLETLDLRLPAESGPNGCCSSGGHNIHCWSSFVQLREFSFDDDRQTLGLEEARWMTGHWRYLHLVRGEFKGDHDELDLLFRQKDIKLIT